MANPTDESADLYDEPMTDQDPRENSSESEEDGDYGQTFLAPKAAFAGKNLEVGAVHKVRVEATHDSEVELRCIKSDAKEESVDEPDDELYA